MKNISYLLLLNLFALPYAINAMQNQPVTLRTVYIGSLSQGEGVNVSIDRNNKRIFTLTFDSTGNTPLNFPLSMGDTITVRVPGGEVIKKYTPSGRTPNIDLMINGAMKQVDIVPAGTMTQYL